MTISTAELEAIRSTVETVALPDTCNILYPTGSVPDGQGGHTATWGTVTAVACRLDGVLKGKSVELVAGASIQDFHQFVITLPHDTALEANYQIVHGGNTYSVIVAKKETSWIAHVRALLELI